MSIQYIFTDWSYQSSLKDPKYPKSKTKEQVFSLMSLQETDQFVKRIINDIIKYSDKPQNHLPRCTQEELWQDPPIYKYYKDPNKTTRATKNFTNEFEANSRLITDGSVGVIIKKDSEVKACRYCSVVGICSQAKEYLQTGLLII